MPRGGRGDLRGRDAVLKAIVAERWSDSARQKQSNDGEELK